MFLTICPRAEAYIDAGSGSYLLQIAIASLLGASLALKSSLANFKAVLLRKRAPKSGSPENEGA
ncbi:hypothetical protein OP10G_0617 [Fimbriimonas ginsengisoli Gsoil 348]|uniref:Uncharacterized protein n=2 Tax=Fimbriimonas ginsengisoli TaxID=1005039 RepID=A0A068NMI7_FIMGI|nr:hypothetical protein OP10G_0617 [Fimbriimonas ginsengisoli Gsoil 348]